MYTIPTHTQVHTHYSDMKEICTGPDIEIIYHNICRITLSTIYTIVFN